MFMLSDAAGRVNVTFSALYLGKDLAVCLYGGDTPYIGAVAVARPRPGLGGPDDEPSAVCSVIALAGNKEDELARSVAMTMAGELGVTVSVSCGIHLDGASAEEIRQALQLGEQLVRDFLEETQRRGAGPRARYA